MCCGFWDRLVSRALPFVSAAGTSLCETMAAVADSPLLRAVKGCRGVPLPHSVSCICHDPDTQSSGAYIGFYDDGKNIAFLSRVDLSSGCVTSSRPIPYCNDRLVHICATKSTKGTFVLSFSVSGVISIWITKHLSLVFICSTPAAPQNSSSIFSSSAFLENPEIFVTAPTRWGGSYVFFASPSDTDVQYLQLDLGIGNMLPGKVIDFSKGGKKRVQKCMTMFASKIVGIACLPKLPIVYIARENGQVEGWDCSFVLPSSRKHPTTDKTRWYGHALYMFNIAKTGGGINVAGTGVRLCVNEQRRELMVFHKTSATSTGLNVYNVPSQLKSLSSIYNVHSTIMSPKSASTSTTSDDLSSMSMHYKPLARFCTIIAQGTIPHLIRKRSSLWVHPSLSLTCFFSVKGLFVACDCRRAKKGIASQIIGSFLGLGTTANKETELVHFHATVTTRKSRSRSNAYYPVVLLRETVGSATRLYGSCICVYGENYFRASLGVPAASHYAYSSAAMLKPVTECKTAPPAVLIAEQSGPRSVQIFQNSPLSHVTVCLETIQVPSSPRATPIRISVDRETRKYFVMTVGLDFLEPSFCVVFGSIAAGGEISEATISRLSGENEQGNRGLECTLRNGSDGVLVNLSPDSFGTSAVILDANRKACTMISLVTKAEITFPFPERWSVDRIFSNSQTPRKPFDGCVGILVYYKDAGDGRAYLGVAALETSDKTVNESGRFCLMEDEIVLDVCWQAIEGEREADPAVTGIEEDTGTHFTVVNKSMAAVLTSRRIVVVNESLKMICSVDSFDHRDLLTVSGVSWLGPVVLLSLGNDSRVLYMTLGGKIKPLCSLGGTSNHCIALVHRDRIMYVSQGTKKQTAVNGGARALALVRPILPLEPLIVGLLDQWTCFKINLRRVDRNGHSVPRTIRDLIVLAIKHFTCKPHDTGGIDDSRDGPSADAGITPFLLSTLSRVGLEDMALYILRPSEIPPISITRAQIAPEARSNVAMASTNLRVALEELLSEESELREYARNPNAGLSSVGSMPLKYGVLGKKLHDLALTAQSLGDFEVASTCLDISGHDEAIFRLLGVLGKHAVPVLKSMLNTLSLTSRDPQLQNAIKAYLEIHNFSANDEMATQSNTRRKRRPAQSNTHHEIDFDSRSFEQFGRRGALLGIGMEELRVPKWSVKSKVEENSEEMKMLRRHKQSGFGGALKPLALDSEVAWLGEQFPNAAEPPQEQRTFGSSPGDGASDEVDGEKIPHKQSVLASITGGADPERAIVCYLRFEDKPGCKCLTEGFISDSGPYSNHGLLLGSPDHINWPVDVDSPVEAVSRKQHQHILQLTANGNENSEYPKGAADVKWGLRVFRAGSESMQLDFNQSMKHRNHSLATYELWSWKDTDKDQCILAVGFGLSRDLEKSADDPWQWSLSWGKSGLQFTTNGGGELKSKSTVSTPGDSEETKPLFFPNRWVHIALTIDAVRSPARVCLYVNGNCVAEGEMQNPNGGDLVNTDPSTALYICPNFCGQITEVRIWALTRPQDQLYAEKDWPLKMAKKGRKKYGIKIVAKGRNQRGASNRADGIQKPTIAKIGGATGGSSRRRTRTRR